MRSTLSAPSLSSFSTAEAIDERIEDLTRQAQEGLLPRAVAENQIRILGVRRRALKGQDELPPEGTIKITGSCIVSRLGGDLVITFKAAPKDDVKQACQTQGLVFSTAQTCKAPFTSNRYIFALELCSGYEAFDKGLDTDAVKNVIERYIKTTKIGMDGLSDDVKKAIGKTQKIVIETSPDRPPVEVEGVEDISDFFKIVDDVRLGHNVFLVGPAGSGKTYLAELVAKALSRPYVTLNCSQYTSPTEIKGGPTIDGYQEGALIECWERGQILILDELPKIDPNTAGLLNEGLAKTKVPVGSPRAVIFNGRNEPKSKAEGFGVIATGNIWPSAESGTYAANSRQDLSLLDRFAGSVYWIGFNEALEKKVATNMLVYSVGMKMRQWILTNRVDSTISFRWLETAASVYNQEMARMTKKRQDSDMLDKGKTFKDHVDGVITTFTPNQQDNLKDELNYDKLFSKNQYRQLDPAKSPF